MQSFPWPCFCLNLFKISNGSKAEFCASVWGMTSSALTNPSVTNYSFPEILIPSFLSSLLNSISIAQPPGTIFNALDAHITTIIAIIASFKGLSTFSINCSSFLLLFIIVAIFKFRHFWNKLNLSAPFAFLLKHHRD